MFFVYIVYGIKSDLNFFYILYNKFHILQLKKSLLTIVYGHVVHHIFDEEEKKEEEYCSGIWSKGRQFFSILTIVREAPGR